MASFPAYTRHPGLLTRLSPWITGISSSSVLQIDTDDALTAVLHHLEFFDVSLVFRIFAISSFQLRGRDGLPSQAFRFTAIADARKHIRDRIVIIGSNPSRLPTGLYDARDLSPERPVRRKQNCGTCRTSSDIPVICRRSGQR